MNAKRLLAHFDRIADAPDAIPRLRRFVLNLAVRGKLVEQDPSDEPASELLKRIAADKKERSAPTRNRSTDLPEALDSTQLPFDVPSNWICASFGNITISRDRERVPVSRAERQIRPKVYDYYGASGVIDKIDGYLFDKPLLLIGEDGANLINRSTPIAFIARGKYWVNNHAHVLDGVSEEFLRYLELFINATDLKPFVTGTAQPKMNQTKMNSIPVALPPVAEQNRLIAKVDELMALFDRLEETRSAREDSRNRLAKASRARLSVSNSGDVTFRTHARFAVDTLPALTISADQVKRLRKTILDLAVRGKLVEQNPADEPASELLKRVEAEKNRLVKTGAIRRQKALVLLDVENIPFRLPRAWAWTQIEELGVIGPRNDFPDNHVASFVPMRMIPAEYGASSTCESRPWGEIKKGYTHFAEGDVGLAKITPCFENGKSVVFRSLTGAIGSGTTELHIVRPILVDADYVVLFLKSPLFVENGIQRMTGTAGQKRVPREYFANSPFPLPPVAEQRRIVAKVDELMTLCDRLEAGFGTVDMSLDCLLESLIVKTLERTETKW